MRPSSTSSLRRRTISEPRVGVAFLGAGIVAEMHGRAVAATSNVRLVTVFDPNLSRARTLARRFGAKVGGTLQEVLNDSRVSAVHVLTAPDQHVRLALKCLKAGKHVLVEKPVAWRRTDIRKLQLAAKAANRVCMPAHNYIYNPSLRRAKRLIEEGKLGRIGSLWIIYNIYHPEKVASIYGGVMRAVCVHHAYSLLYLLGRPSRLAAMTSRVHYRRLTCEDQAVIVCQMPNGAIANLWCSFAAKDLTSDPWTVVYKVLGTAGGVSYTWNEAQFEDDRGPGWGLPCYLESFRNEVDHFINGCVLNHEQPLSTLADALDALQIIETAERSSSSAGKAETMEYDS